MDNHNNGALFFKIPESSYLSAFFYAAITSAITTAMVVEYRILNPFGTYIDALDSGTAIANVRYTHILQTTAIAFSITLFVLVLLHVCFRLGDGLLTVQAR